MIRSVSGGQPGGGDGRLGIGGAFAVDGAGREQAREEQADAECYYCFFRFHSFDILFVLTRIYVLFSAPVSPFSFSSGF